MRRRLLPRDSRLAVLLLLLGPGLALACSMKPPGGWKKRTPNGRLTLLHLGMPSGDTAQLVLRETRTGKVRWDTWLETSLYEENVWLAPDGTSVVALTSQDVVMVLGPDGQKIHEVDLKKHFSEGEQQRLPRTDCGGFRWVERGRFEEYAFVAEIPTGPLSGESAQGARRTSLRISLAHPQVFRPPEPLMKESLTLMAGYESETDPEIRLRFADELWGRSLVPGRRSRELSLFWLKRLADPQTPSIIYRMAVDSMGFIASPEDFRALTRLPGAARERDLWLLDMLERRAPEEGGTLALRLLESHPEVEVRRRALDLLCARSPAVASVALQLARQDQDPGLREEARKRLSQPASARP